MNYSINSLNISNNGFEPVEYIEETVKEKDTNES